MKDIKAITASIIDAYLKKNNYQSTKFSLEFPPYNSLGTVSTNVAFNKELGNNPSENAVKAINEITSIEGFNQYFFDVKVAGPGFINFYAKESYFEQMLQEIVQNDSSYGSLKQESPQKVMVEFGDPNPFKEIHIGHLRNFCIGESFCRLLESQGNSVVRANYQGDVGLHVAKALYGIKNQEFDINDENIGNEEKAKMLAASYAYGATEFENNENAKQEIIEINKKIYFEDESLKSLWEEGRKISLEHFENLYQRIGVRYDKYYFESVTAKKGREVVLSHIDDGVFERHEGAVVYRGEQEGLHTRVFLTSQDYATYEGKDLALAILKSEDEEYDRSVILTGNEQLEYFQVMLAALKKIRPDLAQKTDHYTFGHVRLKEGKMSSRTGDVITADWLLDEAVKRVNAVFTDMDEATVKKVGVGAVKYSMLKFSIPSDIHFSFEESITLEGNSGPYLQYAFVRTQSVLAKANDQWLMANGQDINHKSSIINHSLETEENDLLRFLSQYPYHVEVAAKEFAPNLLCNYLFELSQKFNLFYQKCKIIGNENEIFRLQLTKGVGIVLQNGLHLLGIETVEKM